jgi:hypothetical protein
MPTITEHCVFWAVIVVQMVGLASVAVARLTERSSVKAVFQRAFFICLLVVGLATMLVIRLDNSYWLSCAATLGLMSVGATIDCGSRRHAPQY